jgi:two-component system response regulator HydG
VLERAEEQARTSEALRLSDERLALLEGELLRHKIVGRSRKLLASYDALRRFAKAGARVLLRGETGTGKELFARAYAASSPRAGRAYIPVPIPALAPTLVESELFGHVRGAFTEASHDKKGRLELAHGGVLFLDEVGDVQPALQAKLLRFLDSGELYRVGDTEARSVDALVVSATNRPLETMASEGRFRDDLLARLGQVVEIPPLRERPEDVPVLVEHFLEMYARGARRKVFSEDALQALQACRWELNVRQLGQVVERVVCLVDHQVIGPDDLPESLRHQPLSGRAPDERASEIPSTPRRLKEVVDELEKAHILRTLEFTQGNRTRAIEILQISPETFYRRLEEFGLHRRRG